MPNLEFNPIPGLILPEPVTIQDKEKALIYYLTRNLNQIVRRTRGYLGAYTDHNAFKNTLPILWVYLYLDNDYYKNLRADLPQQPDLFPALYAFERAVWLLVVYPYHAIYTHHVHTF